MSKFKIDCTIGGVSLLCYEYTESRECALSEVVTATNGVATRKRGAKRRFITLSGKILSDDYSTLRDKLENSLETTAAVVINDVEAENAEIVGYNLKIKAGETLGDISVRLFLDNE